MNLGRYITSDMSVWFQEVISADKHGLWWVTFPTVHLSATLVVSITVQKFLGHGSITSVRSRGSLYPEVHLKRIQYVLKE